MTINSQIDLYQQMILDHNRKPKNFREIENPSHQAEGFNPLCGDHLWVYLLVDDVGYLADISFKGSGCAISKASASMMTAALKGRSVEEAEAMFGLFNDLLKGRSAPSIGAGDLGKLKVFSGICQFPSRVKCASLAWHALNGALKSRSGPVCTEAGQEEQG